MKALPLVPLVETTNEQAGSWYGNGRGSTVPHETEADLIVAAMEHKGAYVAALYSWRDLGCTGERGCSWCESPVTSWFSSQTEAWDATLQEWLPGEVLAWDPTIVL